MSHKERICVFGGGAFGTALAQSFAQSGALVRIWARSQVTVDEVNHHKRNLKYSGETKLHSNISASSNLTQCFKDSDIWVYACPSSFFQEFLQALSNGVKTSQFTAKALVNTCKGLEPKSLRLYHTVAEEILGEEFLNNFYLTLSGPSFASEILHSVPTCVTLSSKSSATLTHIQRQLSNPTFRIYTNNDLIGTELGGAMKNVLAIAAGAIHGLGFGYNTQAAFINLGLGEMIRLGRAMGAKQETFLGFSGVGDLLLTCTSPLSRNRSFGNLLGEGKSVDEAFKICASTIEGYTSSKIIFELTKQKIVRAPICEQVYLTLHEAKSLKEAVQDLLNNPPRAEWV